MPKFGGCQDHCDTASTAVFAVFGVKGRGNHSTKNNRTKEMPAKVSKERVYNCSECKQGQDGEREQPQASAKEEGQFKIQRCIQSLVHSTHCRDINCQHLSCVKMKRVLEHTKTCKRKTGGGCRICQELIHLCCYHAKHCQERECVVPFCRHIKRKLRQQHTQQRLAQSQSLRQRLATMQRSGMQAPPQMASQMPPSVEVPGAVGQPHLQQPPVDMAAQAFPHEH
ncbi:hypothetical protein ACROYT_G019541 [Oculina patagonica]